MSRGKAFALCVSLGVHAALLWMLLHEPSAADAAKAEQEVSPPPPAAATRSERAAEAPRSGPSARASSDRLSKDPPGQRSGERAEQPRDEALRRAYASGRAYEATRQEWLRRHYRERFGDEVGALMELPLAEGWRRLEELATGGNRDAGAALLEMAPACLARPMPDGFDDRMRNVLVRDTSALDAAFITGAYDAEVEGHLAVQQQCAHAGFGLARLRAMIEARNGPLPPGRTDAWDFIEPMFRKLFGHDRLSGPRDAQGDLEYRLAHPGAAVDQRELDALFAALDSSPRAVELVASCYIEGCNGIPAQPQAERQGWSLRAARLGSTSAILDLAKYNEGVGNLSVAYEWLGFERWLALQACVPFPGVDNLMLALRRHARVAALLSPSERAEAERRTQALIDRYGQGALAAQDCVPDR